MREVIRDSATGLVVPGTVPCLIRALGESSSVTGSCRRGGWKPDESGVVFGVMSFDGPR